MKRISFYFMLCLAIFVFSGSYQIASCAETGTGVQASRTLASAQYSQAGRSRSGKNVANYGMSRREIKSIPITERPNRPGHFYGNAVRRRTGM